MTLFGLLVVGFLLGMRHALEADHVAAVAAMTSRAHSVSDGIKLGAAWGLGHSVMLFLFGSVALWMDGLVPEKLANGLELAVGVILIALGLDLWRRLLVRKIHYHVHHHDDGTVHLHAHSHERGEEHEHRHPRAEGFPFRALAIGAVHGMAGSAALVLLALSSAPSAAAGLLYIVVFGLGSILGMALLSTIVAVPVSFSAKRLEGLHRVLQGSIGLASVLLGVLMVYQRI